MGFVRYSESTAIVSLNSMNHLIVVMETCCVFFEVGTDFLNTIYNNFVL
jgi:hypothetical protein